MSTQPAPTRSAKTRAPQPERAQQNTVPDHKPSYEELESALSNMKENYGELVKEYRSLKETVRTPVDTVAPPPPMLSETLVRRVEETNSELRHLNAEIIRLTQFRDEVAMTRSKLVGALKSLTEQ